MAQTIFNKFLFYKTESAFNTALANEAFSPNSIVFVGQEADTKVDPALNEVHFIYTHGRRFDTDFDPASIQAAIAALDGRLDTLEGGENIDGSVAHAVKALSDTLMGLLGNGFDTTNTVTKKVGDNASDIATLKGDAETAGSVAKAIKDAIGGLDVTEVNASATGEAIVKISETDGKISATKGDIAAAHVTIADSAEKFTATTVEAALAELDTAYKAAIAALGTNTAQGTTGQAITSIIQTAGVVTAESGNIDAQYVNYTPQGEEGAKDTNKTNIQETTKEIYGKIRDLTASSALTLVDANDATATTVKADGTTYKLKQGASVVAQFNIMKETFLDTSATGLVWFKTAPSTFATTGNTEGESSPTDYAGWTAAEKKAAVAYLKLVMRTDADGDPGTTGDTTVNAYIPAESLIATYTGATASDSVITVAVSDANVITATIGDGTIALAKLTSAAQNTLSSYKTTINTTVSGGNHITITKTAGDESNGTGDSYAITESNIADADDLTAEITARKAVDGQSGDTYTANPGTNYISGATSLNNADILLDTQVKANADNISAEVTRAESAETAIDGAIGLTKGVSDETRTYTNTGEYIGKQSTNTVKSDIKALDTQAKANADDIATLNGSDSTPGSVAKKIKDAIEDLNAEVASNNGSFVNVTVTEANGEITAVSVAEGDADDIVLSSGYIKATGTISAITGGESIETAIEKIDGRLDNLNSASPFEYTNASNKSTVLKGSNLTAQNVSEVAVGQYNKSVSGKTQFSVGIGAANAQKNGIEIQNDGTIIIYPYASNGTFSTDSAILQEILHNEIDWYEGN